MPTSTSTLSVESLRQQLAIEESSLITDTSNENTTSAMECLRSPTTRTVMAIIQNKNHFEVIREYVLDAEREEKETQELIDAAEEVQSMPISSHFAETMRNSVQDDTIKFYLPRNAAGDVIGMKKEDSAILKRWGRRPATPPNDDDPNALDVPIMDLEAGSDNQMKRNRGLARNDGNHASSSPADKKNLTEQEQFEEEHVKQIGFVSPSGGDEGSSGSETPATISKRSQSAVATSQPKASLQDMLRSQQTELAERKESLAAYTQMVNDYDRWQTKRHQTFQALLEPAPDPPAAPL